MKINLKNFLFAILLANLIFCQEDESLKIITNTTETNLTESEKNETQKNLQNFDLPKEILEEYSEYQNLEDYNNTCTYENYIDNYNEKTLSESIRAKNCIPNYKTFQLILDAGWFNLTEHLVKNIYLPQLIDPSHTMYTYLKKFESQSGKLKHLLADTTKYEKLPINYAYENFENSIKISIPLPDPSFNVEYLSVYCYKDLFKINAIFKARNKFVKFSDSKKLFDFIDGDCESNYNNYNQKLEITFNKVSKLKKWTTLFK
jgi:hypothetical protein